MRYIELFSGCGGMGHGLMQAGMECVGYCEIYSPLERKHEEQTQAIERVIAELEAEHIRNFDLEKCCEKLEDQYYRQGGQDGLAFAIDKLKEVQATETNNSNSPNGYGTHDSGDGKKD